MSPTQNESFDSSKTQEKIAAEISNILRQDYEDSGAAIKRIERKSGLSHHAVRNWYDGCRVPGLENFMLLTEASPKLVEWFLRRTGHDGLADIMQAQRQAAKNDKIPAGFDPFRLIFETESSDALLRKMQKLTLRQLWFYAKIKQGDKLQAHDLVYVFGIGRATAYRDIDGLLKCGLLCRTGSGRDEYCAVL